VVEPTFIEASLVPDGSSPLQPSLSQLEPEEDEDDPELLSLEPDCHLSLVDEPPHLSYLYFLSLPPHTLPFHPSSLGPDPDCHVSLLLLELDDEEEEADSQTAG